MRRTVIGSLIALDAVVVMPDRSLAKHVDGPDADCKARRARCAPDRHPNRESALARLLAPVRTVRGVGPVLAGALDRLLGRGDGGARRLDLLWHLPHGVIEHRLRGRRSPKARA